MFSGMTNKLDILVGVCYRPLSQDEEKDDTFYKQLVEVARSPALALMGTLISQTYAVNTIQT